MTNSYAYIEAIVKRAADAYRARVEIAVRKPDGTIYSGVWGDKGGVAFPGGGIDPGETPEAAALRELEEETGIQAKNPRLLPVTAQKDWSPEERAKNKARGRDFAGSRTQYVIADYAGESKTQKLDKWDAKDKKWRTREDALKVMANVPDTDPYKSPRQKLLDLLEDAQVQTQQKAAKVIQSVLLKAAQNGTLVPKEGVSEEKPAVETTQTKRFRGNAGGVKMPVPYRVQQRTRSFAKKPVQA